MKSVRVEVLAVRQTEQVTANFHVERLKGTTWNRTRVITVVSGQPDAVREFLLEDDERLVIEGATRKIVEYDREQNATKIVDADPGVREAQKRADDATRDANVLREKVTAEVKPQVAAAAAEAQPRTNLGNPAPARPPASPPPAAKPPGGTPPNTAGGGTASHGQGATGTKELPR